MATNEGTDPKSAERNLRLEYENLKKDEFVKKETQPTPTKPPTPVKKMAKGGSASSRADGIAQRGKTRGKIV